MSGPRNLDPRIVTVWRLQAAVLPLLGTVAVLVLELAVGDGSGGPPWPPGVGAVAVALVGGLASVTLPALAYRRWRYQTAATTLELRHGVVVRTESSIPYWRVQHVDLTAGPLDRLFGLSRLVLHTASATTDATIPGVASERADELRTLILDRAGTNDGV
ncbi:PH domain-containing protein [soil metagenome]